MQGQIRGENSKGVEKPEISMFEGIWRDIKYDTSIIYLLRQEAQIGRNLFGLSKKLDEAYDEITVSLFSGVQNESR